MDRGKRRQRTDRKVARREALAAARHTKVRKRGKLRRHSPEIYRCDCDRCSSSRQGKNKDFPADLTDA